MFALGVGYILVSRNTGENRAVVILGVIGKSMVFVDCAVSVFSGQAGGILLAIGVIELLFTVLFVEFLNIAGKEN